MTKKMMVERGPIDWCDSGYHKITTKTHEGREYKFGAIGAATCLLDDNLDPVTGNGYHKIDLETCVAYIGAAQFPFTDHARLDDMRLAGYTARPSANPAWDGSGLPPVGCECEVQYSISRGWMLCEILSVGSECVFIRNSERETCDYVREFSVRIDKCEFRPIDTRTD